MQTNIAIIAPSNSFAETFTDVLKKKGLDYPIYISTGKSTLEIAKQLSKKNVKIIISRGHNVDLLRKVLSIPIIDVRFTYEDIYYSYKEAQKYGANIAFVGFKTAVLVAKLFQKISGNPITIINVDKIKKVNDKLLLAKNNGISVFIGGRTTETITREISAFYVGTVVSEGAVESAINDALHLLHIENERVISQSITSSLLESTNNGILAIDNNQNLLFINNQAKSMLMNKYTEFINQYLSHLDLNKNISNKQIDKLEVEDRVIIFNGNPLTFFCKPIYSSDSNTYGYVAIIQDIKQVQSTEKEIRKNLTSKVYSAKKNFTDIIGQSIKNQNTIIEAQQYALSDATILITGESGTGKELYAQSIHNFSKRKHEPFIAVNCAALTESLLESELFGYVKGAFTGAKNEGKEGLFEIAHKGTIFLDEIGEVSKSFQVKLLRVLQEKEITRVGDSKVIPVDVRIIVATNKNLIKRIKKKKFREDLYYRLSVLKLNIPPLRERSSDIPELIENFIFQYKKTTVFSQESIKLLMKYSYPGNIRQLQNILERLSILSKEDQVTPVLTTQVLMSEPALSDEITAEDYKVTNLVDYEKEIILNTLKKNNNIKSLTAQELGISTATLWRKLKNYKN